MSFNQNPNSELSQSVVIGPSEVEVPESLIGEAIEFRNEMMKYSCAIRELKTKLEVLNDELSVRNQRNPIEMIKSRVKRPESIFGKLRRRGLPLTVESMTKNLDDIAGIKRYCRYSCNLFFY